MDSRMGGHSGIGGSPLLNLVHEGMAVVDVDGDKVGTVSLVKMGDSSALTTRGNEITTAQDTNLIGQMGGEALDDEFEPEVPEPVRSQLVREGFIKIDGGGLFDLATDRYASANQIAAVDDDTVRLLVDRDDLSVEL